MTRDFLWCELFRFFFSIRCIHTATFATTKLSTTLVAFFVFVVGRQVIFFSFLPFEVVPYLSSSLSFSLSPSPSLSLSLSLWMCLCGWIAGVYCGFHYTQEGYELLAAAVNSTIRAALLGWLIPVLFLVVVLFYDYFWIPQACVAVLVRRPVLSYQPKPAEWLTDFPRAKKDGRFSSCPFFFFFF